FSGTIKVNAPPNDIPLFGLDITILGGTVTIKNNSLTGGSLKARIKEIPLIGGPLGISLNLDLHNDFKITLDTSDISADISLPNIADFSFKSLSIDFDPTTKLPRFK